MQPAASLGLSASAASENAKRAVAKLRAYIAAACEEASSHDGYLRKVCALKKGQLKGPVTIRTFQALLGGAVLPGHAVCLNTWSAHGPHMPARRRDVSTSEDPSGPWLPCGTPCLAAHGTLLAVPCLVVTTRWSWTSVWPLVTPRP